MFIEGATSNNDLKLITEPSEFAEKGESAMNTAMREPKQLGEIVIEIAGEKLQVAECENGMLLCSENGAGKKKVDCDTFKQELKEKLMRTAKKNSEQTRTAAVPVKRVHKLLKCQERLGETSINTVGEKMEIVRYNNANDMTVRFEDGTEKEGVRYEKFKRGYVKKPESWEKGSSKKKRMHNTGVKKWKCLGEVRKNKEGETMEIVQYNNANNMTVRFEDGTEKADVSYFNFERGNVRKPKRESIGKKEFLQRAEAYLVSAKALLEGNESMLVLSVVLCKKAAIDFLKSALESRTEGKTSKGETEDI